MSIKVGAAPVSWGIFELEGLGAPEPYAKVLDEMREAGYEGTELGPYGYLPTDPARLAAELSARNLRLVSAFVPVPLTRPERHEQGFEDALRVTRLLSALGGSVIVLADEMTPQRMAVAGRVIEDRDGMNEQQWKSALEILSRIARACRDFGVRAAFHPHVGSYVETPREIEELCNRIDADLLGLCWDTGHYFYGGGDPVDAVRRYRSRIRHLHLKDIRLSILENVRGEGLGFLEAVRRGLFCELGEGGVDVAAVIKGLMACGYDQWAVVEQDVDASKSDARPLESALRSRNYLRTVIGI